MTIRQMPLRPYPLRERAKRIVEGWFGDDRLPESREKLMDVVRHAYHQGYAAASGKYRARDRAREKRERALAGNKMGAQSPTRPPGD
jgi:hypothetical protein